MTWFKIDDGLPDHPKTIALQSHRGWQGALSLWTLAGAWVSKHLTDGFVPEAIVTRLGCAKKDAAVLVASGFWERAEGGYTFHDWHARNPTKASVEEKREKTRTKVSEWRRNNPGNPVTVDDGNPPPVPSRPVPSEREGERADAPPPKPLTAGAENQNDPPRSPARLLAALDEDIRCEYARLGKDTQRAGRTQYLDGCVRVDDAVANKRFADAAAAVAALAKAAVAESVRPGGKPLGIALMQVPFSADRKLGVLELRRAAGITYIPRDDE